MGFELQAGKAVTQGIGQIKLIIDTQAHAFGAAGGAGCKCDFGRTRVQRRLARRFDSRYDRARALHGDQCIDARAG